MISFHDTIARYRFALGRERVLPVLALVIVVVLAVRNFGSLLGVAPGHALAWAVPVAFLVVGAAGTATRTGEETSR